MRSRPPESLSACCHTRAPIEHWCCVCDVYAAASLRLHHALHASAPRCRSHPTRDPVYLPACLRACSNWGLGCILYELVCLRRPFEHRNMAILLAMIQRNQPSPIPAHYSPQLRAIVEGLLEKTPQERLTADQVLALPLISDRLPALGLAAAVSGVSSASTRAPVSGDPAAAGARSAGSSSEGAAASTPLQSAVPSAPTLVWAPLLSPAPAVSLSSAASDHRDRRRTVDSSVAAAPASFKLAALANTPLSLSSLLGSSPALASPTRLHHLSTPPVAAVSATGTAVPRAAGGAAAAASSPERLQHSSPQLGAFPAPLPGGLPPLLSMGTSGDGPSADVASMAGVTAGAAALHLGSGLRIAPLGSIAALGAGARGGSGSTPGGGGLLPAAASPLHGGYGSNHGSSLVGSSLVSKVIASMQQQQHGSSGGSGSHGTPHSSLSTSLAGPGVGGAARPAGSVSLGFSSSRSGTPTDVAPHANAASPLPSTARTAPSAHVSPDAFARPPVLRKEPSSFEVCGDSSCSSGSGSGSAGGSGSGSGSVGGTSPVADTPAVAAGVSGDVPRIPATPTAVTTPSSALAASSTRPYRLFHVSSSERGPHEPHATGIDDFGSRGSSFSEAPPQTMHTLSPHSPATRGAGSRALASSSLSSVLPALSPGGTHSLSPAYRAGTLAPVPASARSTGEGSPPSQARLHAHVPPLQPPRSRASTSASGEIAGLSPSHSGASGALTPRSATPRSTGGAVGVAMRAGDRQPSLLMSPPASELGVLGQVQYPQHFYHGRSVTVLLDDDEAAGTTRGLQQEPTFKSSVHVSPASGASLLTVPSAAAATASAALLDSASSSARHDVRALLLSAASPAPPAVSVDSTVEGAAVPSSSVGGPPSPMQPPSRRSEPAAARPAVLTAPLVALPAAPLGSHRKGSGAFEPSFPHGRVLCLAPHAAAPPDTFAAHPFHSSHAAPATGAPASAQPLTSPIFRVRRSSASAAGQHHVAAVGALLPSTAAAAVSRAAVSPMGPSPMVHQAVREPATPHVVAPSPLSGGGAGGGAGVQAPLSTSPGPSTVVTPGSSFVASAGGGIGSLPWESRRKVSDPGGTPGAPHLSRLARPFSGTSVPSSSLSMLPSSTRGSTASDQGGSGGGGGGMHAAQVRSHTEPDAAATGGHLFHAGVFSAAPALADRPSGGGVDWRRPSALDVAHHATGLALPSAPTTARSAFTFMTSPVPPGVAGGGGSAGGAGLSSAAPAPAGSSGSTSAAVHLIVSQAARQQQAQLQAVMARQCVLSSAGGGSRGGDDGGGVAAAVSPTPLVLAGARPLPSASATTGSVGSLLALHAADGGDPHRANGGVGGRRRSSQLGDVLVSPGWHVGATPVQSLHDGAARDMEDSEEGRRHTPPPTLPQPVSRAVSAVSSSGASTGEMEPVLVSGLPQHAQPHLLPPLHHHHQQQHHHLLPSLAGVLLAGGAGSPPVSPARDAPSASLLPGSSPRGRWGSAGSSTPPSSAPTPAQLSRRISRGNGTPTSSPQLAPVMANPHHHALQSPLPPMTLGAAAAAPAASATTDTAAAYARALYTADHHHAVVPPSSQPAGAPAAGLLVGANATGVATPGGSSGSGSGLFAAAPGGGAAGAGGAPHLLAHGAHGGDTAELATRAARSGTLVSLSPDTPLAMPLPGGKLRAPSFDLDDDHPSHHRRDSLSLSVPPPPQQQQQQQQQQRLKQPQQPPQQPLLGHQHSGGGVGLPPSPPSSRGAGWSSVCVPPSPTLTALASPSGTPAVTAAAAAVAGLARRASRDSRDSAPTLVSTPHHLPSPTQLNALAQQLLHAQPFDSRRRVAAGLPSSPHHHHHPASPPRASAPPQLPPDHRRGSRFELDGDASCFDAALAGGGGGDDSGGDSDSVVEGAGGGGGSGGGGGGSLRRIASLDEDVARILGHI